MASTLSFLVIIFLSLAMTVCLSKTYRPTTHLRNGYYSPPILKKNLRGNLLPENDATYNPPNRFCYSIMHAIKSLAKI